MEETAVLIERSQAGDKEARERLIEENLGLVRHIVKRFLDRGYDAEDLFQIGCIGLMKAIDKFDLSFEVKFSTYAVPMIQGEIKRFLRDDGMVKVSRSLKENGWKIRQVSERMSQQKGRDATVEEISEETGIEVEDIVIAMAAGRDVESIYQTVYQGDGNKIYVVDKLAAAAESETGDVLINRMMLEQMLDDLEENERQLITMRYFEDKTQSQVAEKLGISQVQVSRLEKKILLRMRKFMEV